MINLQQNNVIETFSNFFPIFLFFNQETKYLSLETFAAVLSLQTFWLALLLSALL